MGFVKKLAVIAILCIAFRVSYALGADVALDSYIQSAVSDETRVANTVISQSPLLMSNVDRGPKAKTEAEEETEADADAQSDANTETESEAATLYYTGSLDAGRPEGESKISEEDEKIVSDSGTVKEKTITGGEGYLSSDGISVKNYTTYDIDISGLLNQEVSVSLQPGAESPQVLIIHTHGSEAYMPDGTYEESDTYRTQDKEHSVIKVGDELESVLEAMGISVIHDREIYDYPSYIGSYGRSLTAAEAYMEQYPSIQVIIDLHRDALMEDDGTVYKTVAEVNGGQCAQVMMVVGTDNSGLSHNNWRQNFTLALKLQSTMNEKYPSLARPISLREERFNHHLTTGAILLEVGTNGNTLEEAITAAGYFADCLADVLLTG